MINNKMKLNIKHIRYDNIILMFKTSLKLSVIIADGEFYTYIASFDLLVHGNSKKNLIMNIEREIIKLINELECEGCSDLDDYWTCIRSNLLSSILFYKCNYYTGNK